MDLLKKLFQETLKMRILQRKYHSRNKDYHLLNELKNKELEVDLLLNKIYNLVKV